MGEVETDRYRVYIPEHLRGYYKRSGGGTLSYCIEIKEPHSCPTDVVRTLTYLNGFQTTEEGDYREVGVGIRQPIEHLELMVDFEMLPLTPTDVFGELRVAGTVAERLEVREAGPKFYHVAKSHPRRNASVYIKWKWKERADS